MTGIRKTTEIWENVDRETFLTVIKPQAKPAVLKGLVRHWPAVAEGLASPASLAGYINRFYNGVPAPMFEGAPDINGRFAYTADLSAINFEPKRGAINELLDWLIAHGNDDHAPARYAGSLSIPAYFPDFSKQNSAMGLIPAGSVMESIWIGNRTCIAPHYDNTENIACVVGGRRRFTLFPIEQMKNLYIGPPDLTPAGQIISLVDTRKPDYERFPLYAEAETAGEVADLEPGDALYIPTLWWHGVESLDPFGVLVNYWWRDVPDYFESPARTLQHALLSLKDLPPQQRLAWKSVFDHLIFQVDGDPLAHLPKPAQGSHGGLTADLAARLRAFLAKSLNR